MSSYFDIPFEEKDLAKKFGAKWDNNIKLWYAPTFEVGVRMLTKWTEISNVDEHIPCVRYLNVPIVDKNEVKRLGARWDNDKKQWYAPTEYVFNKTKKWEIKRE